MPLSMTWLSRNPSARSVDSLITAFDAGAERPNGGLTQFWARWRSHRPLSDLSALIKSDLRRRFERGERPAVASYLDQFPELAGDKDRVLSLVYEEFCLLDEHQANPTVSDFCRRYEPWGDSIASQLGYHQRFSQIVATERPSVAYPGVGERFASYQLQQVLGQGGTAQVYLATDGELAERQVVLKLTPNLGLEPTILAGLEHPNIVPIHSVVRLAGSPLQGICMPYRPGITLDRLLGQLLAGGPPRRAGLIWDLLGLDRLNNEPANRAWRDFPIHGTYIEAVAWLGLEMAQALAYLHGRGVFHRDVKPANILLSAQGGPLLIDFNLAHSPHTPEQAREAMSGGTLPYMAPEQLQAFLDPQAWGGVGAPADLYALGLVLRELVTGIRPSLPDSTLPLDRAIAGLRDRRHEYAASARNIRPDLPPSLDAILSKCLAFHPEDRYASAQDLGEDLRRFLQRRPLVNATNSSPLERTTNWTYRHPRSAVSLGLMAAVLTLGLAAGGHRAQWSAKVGAFWTNGPSNSTKLTPTSYDALHDPAFQQVLLDLESNPFRNWGGPREVLLRLAQQHPESAWPLVYLSQVEQHLLQAGVNEQGLKPEEWRRESFKKLDAKAALEHCLKRAPDRLPVLLTLGNVAVREKDYEGARRYYDEALQIDPNQPSTLLMLAQLANQQKRLDEVIRLQTKLLGINSSQVSPDQHLQIRRDHINVVLRQLDAVLSNPTAPDAIPKARALAQTAATQIEAMRRESSTPTPPKGAAASLLADWRKSSPYSIALSEGTLASGLAYLNGLTHDTTVSREQFAAAQAHFAQARAQALAMPENLPADRKALTRTQVLSMIDGRVRLLGDRQQRLATPASAEPSSPTASEAR